MVRVLVVEDERKLLASLESCLRAAGYEVAGAATGEEGLRLALEQSFDCLVLDRVLPVLSGLEVLAELRRAGKTLPVLILTARDAVEDRVEGLDLGRGTTARVQLPPEAQETLDGSSVTDR
jgi:DNA-binding response OmpR family regulator